MSEIYLLTKPVAGGMAMVHKPFDSERAVLAYLVENGHARLSPKFGDPGSYTVEFDQKYEVQKLQVESSTALSVGVNTDHPYIQGNRYVGEHEYPPTVIMVQSESDPDMLYGVAVNDGRIYACTCPAFEFSEPKRACKHMETALYDNVIRSHARLVKAGRSYSWVELSSFQSPTVTSIDQALVRAASTASKNSGFNRVGRFR